MARFESVLECSSSVDIRDIQADVSEGFDPVYPSDALASVPSTTIAPKKKAADPAPSRFSPWLLSLAYPFGRFCVFPAYFGRVEVTGREYLPGSGPVILAPTHRSRWDALMVPFAAGYHVTGRHLRFMVSADEVTGLQGWFIRRLGGFPINTSRPAIASLRHGVELLEQGEVLVIFPEGNIFRENTVHPLKPGLARLAVQAETHGNLGIQVVPMNIRYSNPLVPWRTNAQVHIGSPLRVADYCTGCSKKDAKSLTAALQAAMEALNPQD
ncbi:1-acyl-sn-glycerol-3-phosphate acyltransferase [Leptolyngbyaceae cyanobacterium JSC-12]|nr:1-acyl-sn-glycerol-3-phosphate acyltransferase [Leptolyngbyaceae cyanobacterium JSC-12]